MHDRTGIQRDLLYVIAGLQHPQGLASKDELDDYYGSESIHGRLYPILDTLVEKGLVDKSKQDDRANEYTLTTRGAAQTRSPAGVGNGHRRRCHRTRGRLAFRLLRPGEVPGSTPEIQPRCQESGLLPELGLRRSHCLLAFITVASVYQRESSRDDAVEGGHRGPRLSGGMNETSSSTLRPAQARRQVAADPGGPAVTGVGRLLLSDAPAYLDANPVPFAYAGERQARRRLAASIRPSTGTTGPASTPRP